MSIITASRQRYDQVTVTWADGTSTRFRQEAARRRFVVVRPDVKAAYFRDSKAEADDLVARRARQGITLGVIELDPEVRHDEVSVEVSVEDPYPDGDAQAAAIEAEIAALELAIRRLRRAADRVRPPCGPIVRQRAADDIESARLYAWSANETLTGVEDAVRRGGA